MAKREYPIKLVNPKDEDDIVIADSAVDYNNFIFGDGYKVAEDQSGIREDVETVGDAEVASSEPEDSDTSSPPENETPAEKRKREAQEKKDADANKGKATNADGDTVQTA